MKRNTCFATILAACVILVLLVVNGNSAEAETTIVAPLTPLVKTSGFIPNRYITWTNKDGSTGSSSWSHLATDYDAYEGQPVMSIADGTVKETGYSSSSGNYIVIEHSINGITVWSRYQHFSQAPFFSQGASVTAGQQIGTAGHTGNASGPHLHIQIYSGNYPAYVAWDRSHFSGYTLNQEVAGPIDKNGTVFYSPERIINGIDVIGTPDNDTESPVVISARITNATPNSYSIVCEAHDNYGVSKFQIGTWNDVIGVDAAHWEELPAVNGTATFIINISDYGNVNNTTYHTNVYAFDGKGNVSEGVRAGDIYINDAQRKNVFSGVYVIHSALDNNMCLDIQGDSAGNNANIQLFHRVDNNVQKYRVIKWDESYYCIKSIYNGRWLDAASPIGDNSNVKLFDNNDFDEDFWYFEDAGDGYVYIRNKTGYYLDVQGDSGVDHANIQLYHFVGNESQKWRLEDVTDYYSLGDGVYTINTGLDNSYRLDISGDSTENRANIQLYEQTDSAVQLFKFVCKGDYYVIQSVYSNKWLDVHMPISNNANVQLWEDNTANEEHWVLEDAGDGFVYIRSGRDYYLDVQGSEAKNNANIQVFRFLGEDCQKWKISSDKPNVMVIAGTSTQETVIKWNAVSDAQSYGIHIVDNEDNYAHVRWNYNKTAFSALLPEGDYKVRITAVKDSTNSESEYVPFTVCKANTTDIGESWTQTVWNHTLYKLYPKDCSWLEAKALCEQEGGHLVTITSQDEQDIVSNLVSQYGLMVYMGAEGYTYYNWRWITDETFTQYTNWNEGQPDNWDGKENCGMLYTNGTWNDICCTDEQVHGFIAEYPPVDISVTPSDDLLSLLDIDYEQEMEDQTAYYTSHIRDHLTVQATFSDGTVVAVDDYEVTTNLEHDEQTSLRYSYIFTVTYGDLSNTSDINITLKPEPTFAEPDFTLPSVLTTVDDSAFEGIAASVVYVPDTCTRIGKWAFRNCPNLIQIRIPAGCAIGTDAFIGCNDVVIFGTKGSAAETYANSHANCTFVAE